VVTTRKERSRLWNANGPFTCVPTQSKANYARHRTRPPAGAVTYGSMPQGWPCPSLRGDASRWAPLGPPQLPRRNVPGADGTPGTVDRFASYACINCACVGVDPVQEESVPLAYRSCAYPGAGGEE